MSQPALPTPPTYAADSYWDGRYDTGGVVTFDWFFNYPALQSLLRRFLPHGRCLHVGCGNSGLSEGLAHDGFHVTNVDISSVVIDQMRQRHAGNNFLEYRVSDCKQLHFADDSSYTSCLDKGTLDAVLCCMTGITDGDSYLNEVYRVLQPGGVFLLISLGAPAARMAMLQKPPWSVQLLLLPKPLMYLKPSVSRPTPPAQHQQQQDSMIDHMEGSGPRGRQSVSKDDEIAFAGPFMADELPQALKEYEEQDYFYAYVCSKPAVLG